jgi:lipoate-protein ligase A
MVEMGQCIYKVPNGKLLKVTVEFSDNTLKKVQIKGDFFIHPEESLDELEIALENKEYSRAGISDIVGDFFAKAGVIAFGITPKAVVDAILECKGNAK